MAPVGPAVTTAVGVTVAGGYGTTPVVTVPSTAAPSALTQQVLTTGTGAPVAKDDTVIANYVGQTWAEKSGKVNVFDSSFSRGEPAAFLIGEGQVIPGWDTALVGKTLGSRVLLTIPPADGYGSAGQSAANISGTDTLVFVVDLISAYKPDASAPGTVVPNIPTTDVPKITNVPGKEPTITSVAGLTVPTQPTSTLLVKGTGAKIDSTKTLVVQLVETDLATGTQHPVVVGSGPADGLGQQRARHHRQVHRSEHRQPGRRIASGHRRGGGDSSGPSQPALPPEVLIVDVVGQF